jgi:hypothetical protein
VSGVTYKSNITVCESKERERAVNMKNTKLMFMLDVPEEADGVHKSVWRYSVLYVVLLRDQQSGSCRRAAGWSVEVRNISGVLTYLKCISLASS